jgi:FkbM family methyltransferase
MKIVQIGANRGNDDLTKIIGNNQPDLLILVEPFKLHNDTLNKNYSWVNNFHIENVAISNTTGDEIDFYYHLDDGPGYEVASLDPKHIYERHTHLSKDRVSSFKVKTLNINDLFDQFGLTNIDILFIDAEGHDDEIIKTINFEKYNIEQIYFENLHIKDMGIYSLLESQNYNIIKNTGTNGWCSLAKKLN